MSQTVDDTPFWTQCGGRPTRVSGLKLPLAARKTIHRSYHDPDDDARLADLAEEHSVGRSTIHRIVSGSAPKA
jgi:hypothetical protein